MCTMDYWNDAKLSKANVVRENGGVGVIIVDPYQSNEMNFDFMIPTTVIGMEDARKLDAYMRNTR